MTLWYLIRALGFVALVALTGSICLGVLAGVVTPSRHRADPGAAERRITRQLHHRTLAVIGLLALLMHIALILVDSAVDVPPAAALLPFGSGYRPVAVAFGVIALYGFTLAAVSGFTRRLFASSAGAVRSWRTVHATAYLAWAAAIYHGFSAGTDTWWALSIHGLCTGSIGMSLLLRGIMIHHPFRIPTPTTTTTTTTATATATTRQEMLR
ncbi:hypothetical protein [Gordonia sp. NB41Y]|uniref:hypothetical protein n=1 Tax=Gordonia sp. NB41Y TaxID=875808 RepID=UPI0006B184F9|nr:hypothetical protein [Gordonia sp. NB41Y]EMP10236.2 hypothetical protein ISGA_5661 [Gordonia sp. NB41Y]WLP89398.1 hypothetical protein Q9K23_17670 [Gordonia sp. NB41Y]